MDSIVERFQSALMLFSDGQYNEALAIFTSLTENEFSEEDHLFKIMAYKSIASIYTIKNDYERAIKYSKLAFKGYENENNIEEKVNSLLSIGNLYADAGNLAETINYYNQALSLYDDDKKDIKGNQLEKVVTLIDLGVILLENNELKKSLSYFNQSLQILDKYGKLSDKISTFMEIGHIFINKHDMKNAIGYFEELVSLFDHAKDQKARQLIEIGKILFENNEYDKGLEYLERGLKTTPQTALPGELVVIGLFLDKIREFEYAIDFLERAEKIYEESGNKQAKSVVLNKLGDIYSKLGQIERSITQYEESIKINEELSDIQKKAMGLLGLGSVLANKGKLDKALEYFDAALRLFESSDEENRARVFHLIGRTYNKKGDIEKAIVNYKISLDIYNQNEYKYATSKATCIIEMGNIYLKLIDYTNASKNFNEALHILEKYNLDPLLKAEPLVYLGLIYFQNNELTLAEENLRTGFDLLSSRENIFDIINLFDELFQINEDLTYNYAISIPYGLLWLFSKNNELIEANQIITPKFWHILKKATDKWWNLVFDEKEQILTGIQDSRLITKLKNKRGRKQKSEIKQKETSSIFIENWRLKQLIKSTQDTLTNETTVNMLFGSNDLDSGFNSKYESLRDVQPELDPIWFVEVPVKINHGERYLKIRLNNRIKRFGRLIGYPLINKPFYSIKSLKITLETQWLQRFVVDHLFVPNDQWEYEAYEINPTNAWLTDIYVMDLGDNSKKHSKVDLTYKIEFELETGGTRENPIIVKSTNKRLILPIYKKNNLQKLEQYIVRNSNSLAIFVAIMSFIFSLIDISGNFITFNDLLDYLHIIPIYFGFVLIISLIIASPLLVWGRIKNNTEVLRDNLANYKD